MKKYICKHQYQPMVRNSGKYRKLKDSYIYFVRNTQNGHVKVGYSDKPYERLAELQVSNSAQLILWRTLFVTYETRKFWESAIHDNLREYNVRGEWFDVPEAELLKVFLTYKQLIERPIM